MSPMKGAALVCPALVPAAFLPQLTAHPAPAGLREPPLLRQRWCRSTAPCSAGTAGPAGPAAWPGCCSLRGESCKQCRYRRDVPDRAAGKPWPLPIAAEPCTWDRSADHLWAPDLTGLDLPWPCRHRQMCGAPLQCHTQFCSYPARLTHP